MDRIQTKQFACEGGLITNMDLLQQGVTAPGSAIVLSNFEPSRDGGYTRILGHQRYDQAEVPGSGPMLGLAVIGNGVIACRGQHVYFGAGAGWARINGADNRTGAEFYRNQRYNFVGSERIVFVDSVNRPFTVSMSGTGYTVLANAPLGASFVTEFRNRLWFAKGNILTASAALTDDNFNGGDGASEFNVSDRITGLSHFRDRLIIFCENRILRLTGQSRQDFRIDAITENLGCLQPDTIQEVAGDVIFLAPDGLRLVSGTERANDFNLGSVSMQVFPTLRKMQSYYGRLIGFPVRSKGQYRLMAPRTGGIDPAIPSGLIATIRQSSDGASRWEYATTENYYGGVWDSNYDDSGNELVIFGSTDGYVQRAESGNTFAGTQISARYQTPHLVLDDVGVRKVFRKLQVYLRAESTYNLDVSLVLDFNDDTAIQPSKITLSRGFVTGVRFDSANSLFDSSRFAVSLAPPRNQTNLVGAGFAGSFLFESQAAVDPFTISALAVDVSLGGRR